MMLMTEWVVGETWSKTLKENKLYEKFKKDPISKYFKLEVETANKFVWNEVKNATLTR